MLSRDRALRCQAHEGLQVTAQAQGSTQVLSAEGKIDVATTAVLAAAIGDAISRAPQIVVVDVSAVALFAAAGVSALLDADEHARAAGCRLVVIAGEGPAHHVLERTDAQQQLTIAA